MSNTLHHPPSPDQISALLGATLALQRAAYFAQPVPSLDQRRADLRQLQTFIRDNKAALVAAVNADYGNRSRHETLLTEIFPAIDGIKHTLKQLQQWIKPRNRSAGRSIGAIFWAPKTASWRSRWAWSAASCPGIFRST